MPADQQRLIAFALDQLIVAAMAFETAIGQMLTAVAILKTARIIVILKVRQRLALGIAFQLNARLGEVVIAAGDAAGTRRQTQAKALDHRRIRHQPGVLLIRHRRQFREDALVIAKHQ